MMQKSNIVKQNKNPIKRFFEIALRELDHIPFHYNSDEFGKFMKNINSIPSLKLLIN